MNVRRWIAAALGAATLSAHAVGHRADVAVYDRATQQELPVYWHEGRPYVVGRPGNEFEIRVRNRAGRDLLAVVSVDGVNVVTGETANPRQSGYILSSHDRMDLRGWRKSLSDINAFYFTTLGDSYAARTDRPGNVGVIGVALFERARPPEPPPAVLMEKRGAANESAPAAAPRAEAAADASRAKSLQSAPLGTGYGRQEHSPTYYAAFERATAEPVETIAIYYDSYRNLVAQGVLPTPYARRSPDPFPSFVPPPR